MSMGFPRNRCEKAAFHTKNEGADQAMNWLFAHMEDAGFIFFFCNEMKDIDEPLKKPKVTKSEPTFQINEEGIAMLTSMGFSKEKAIKALKATVPCIVNLIV